MGNEDSLNAAEHFEFIRFELAVFGKSISNVVAPVDDKCNINKASARRIGPNFIGCHSPHYNLALEAIMEKNKAAIDDVKEIMKQISFQIPVARLRQVTHCKAKLDIGTPWSSKFQKIKRYSALKQHLEELHLDEIDELLLTSHRHDEVVNICQRLKKRWAL